MTRAHRTSSTAKVIRFGHSMQLGWGVALGISLILALNAFTVVGWLVRLTGKELAPGSLLALLVFLPIVLSYMERISFRRNSNSFFGLIQPNTSNSRRFMIGWLLLLGYLSLAGILAWGMGLYLSILSQSLFRVAIATRWLAGFAAFLMALHYVFQPVGSWSLRTKLVYASLGLVILVAAWGFLQPANGAFALTEPEQPIKLSTTMAFLAANLWFLALIVGYKEDVHRPRRVLLPALLVPLVVGQLLGVLMGVARNFPRAWASSLNSPAQLIPPLEPGSLHLGFVLAGLFISFIVMERVFASILYLIGSLTWNGYLPRPFNKRLPGQETSAYGLLFAMLATGLLAVLVPTPVVTGLASLTFLWVTVLLFGPDVLRSRKKAKKAQAQAQAKAQENEGQKGDGLRLPFDPVFPGLAAVIGLFLPLALPVSTLLGGIVWVILGVGYYLTRVQKSSAKAREQLVFRDAPPEPLRESYSVLVAIMNPETAIPLIRAGALLAQARNGHLIVLHVLDRQEEFTRNLSYLRPEQQLRTVEHFVEQAGLPPDLPVTSFVRVARTTHQGIVETVKDEHVDLLLIGWEETYRSNRRKPSVWEQSLLRLRALQNPAGMPQEMHEGLPEGMEELEEASEIIDLNPMLDRIVQTVTCDVAVLRGELPQRIRQVLIPASGRSSVTTALELGQALVQKDGGKVVALHVVPDILFQEDEMDTSPEGPEGLDNPASSDVPENGGEGWPQEGSPGVPAPVAQAEGRGPLGAGRAVPGPAAKAATASAATSRRVQGADVNGRRNGKGHGSGNGHRNGNGNGVHAQRAGEPSALAPAPEEASQDESAETTQFRALFDGESPRDNVEQKVVRASSVVTGILDMASSYDVVLMNASRLMFLDTHFFNGIPAEVALSRRQPTILVRPYEPKHHRWLRNRWQALAAVFPKLSVAERAEISIAMRQGAQPSIDFFVLIFLAATIATFGLLQNSGAVIIGAMLVAPLMSPIASMAMGLVEGSGQLVRVAAEATVKGIILAVSVGVAVTLISPATQVTDQILARTQPTLLDLAVALASGAAAGYALSRKQVAAALPGVSIAVALVPPLCVVGYGIATSRYTIAGGGLLLFATNLVAIVLAAAIFFLLMGFRPPTTQQSEHFQQGLRLSLVSLVLIAIPLAVLLHISLRQLQQREQLANMEERIQAVLAENIPSKAAYLRSIEVNKEEEEYVVHAIFYDYTTLERALLGRIEGQLNQDLGVPVRLEATLLAAQRVGPEGQDTVPVPPSEAAPAPPEEAPSTANEVTPEGDPAATPASGVPVEPTKVVE